MLNQLAHSLTDWRGSEKNVFCWQNTNTLTTTKDPYFVPGLARGLVALQSFTPQRQEQSLSDLEKVLGILSSAAFRTVHTLAATGYLLQVPGSTRYRLGPRALGLSNGFIASRELVEVSQQPLEQLRDDLDWSSHLGVLDRNHVLYLLRYPASDGSRSLVHVGSRLIASQTAMGRLLLSHKTEREIRWLMADASGFEVQSMLKACAANRRLETVIHEGEFEAGISSIAAPVRDMSGAVIAAISATKSSGRISKDITARVVTAGNAIGKALGAVDSS